MHHDLSSGLSQSDLTIDYRHNEKGVGAGFQKKDIQVFVGEVICTFLLCFIVAASKYTGNNGTNDAHAHVGKVMHHHFHWPQGRLFLLRLLA